MGTAPAEFRELETFGTYLVDPGLEIGVVDAFVTMSFRAGSVADKSAEAGLREEDFSGTTDIGNSSTSENTFEGMAFVERAGGVFDSTLAVFRIWKDAACIAVADEHEMTAHMWELGAEEFEIEARGPRLKGEEP